MAVVLLLPFRLYFTAVPRPPGNGCFSHRERAPVAVRRTVTCGPGRFCFWFWLPRSAFCASLRSASAVHSGSGSGVHRFLAPIIGQQAGQRTAHMCACACVYVCAGVPVWYRYINIKCSQHTERMHCHCSVLYAHVHSLVLSISASLSFSFFGRSLDGRWGRCTICCLGLPRSL